MFIDTSVIVAILADETDAADYAQRIEQAPGWYTFAIPLDAPLTAGARPC